MKKTVLKMLSLAIVLSLFCTLLVTTSSADVGQQGERWNIMLVIDGSASLWSEIKSDPTGLRYEAVNSFLDTLQSTGHMVGAIVFYANQTGDPSDKAMESGIVVNTGMLSLDGSAPREKLKAQAAIVPTVFENTPQTDIGTALLVAERELEKVSGNGNRSAIFLFSDGKIHVYESIASKAASNLQKAEENMRNHGVVFCGVFLNKDGKYESEIQDIVYAANGFNPGTNLGNYYIEITDAKSCADATDRFMTLLGYYIDIPTRIIGNFEHSFRVPGVGVEEFNIRLRTESGDNIPKGINVTFTKPDGTTAQANVVASSCSIGKSYHVYKVERPESGKWTVHVQVPDDNKIAMYYTPVFSFYVGAGLDTDVPPDQMHANQTVTATCYLMQNGQVLTDPNAYREYQCELVLTDTHTGVEKRIDVVPNSNGEYKTQLTMDYGVFETKAVFSCDQLSVSSEHQTWGKGNTVPSVKDAKATLSYSFLSKGAKTLDLDDNIDDLEDGKNLALSISGGSCDISGVSLKGHELTLVGRTCGDGTVQITVTDTQGASDNLVVHVTTKNWSLVIILCILALLVLLVLAVIAVKRGQNKNKLNGNLTLDMLVADDDGNDLSLSGVSLKRPGSDAQIPRKCTLVQLLDEEIKQEYSGLHDELSGAEVARLQQFVSSTGKAFLQSVQLTPVRIKEEGKMVTALRVSVGRESDTLYNSSTKQYSGAGAKFKLRYAIEKSHEDTTDFDDYDGFADDDDSVILEDDIDDQYSSYGNEDDD